MNDAQVRIAAAYDPAALETAGNKLLLVLAEHVARVEMRSGKVLNWNDPVALTSEARQMMEGGSQIALSEAAPRRTEAIADRVVELTRAMLARGQNLHHPHYVGHQVPPPVPLAGLFDMIGSVTNQAMAVFEMGPWATAVEHAVIGAVGERLGFCAGQFSGLITSGGSMANLTGLLAARNVSLGDAWKKGVSGRCPAPVLVAHGDAHYSVMRSAGILGIGTDQVVAAALDARRRIDAKRLDETLRDLRLRCVPIIAVSACACATPIGSFDPLSELVDVCRRHDVWLHVDAAHGGAACFSARYRSLISGIDRADSAVCDAHKMMCMPALCAMLFYRERDHRLAAFHQEAPYLFDPIAPYLADYDSGVVNLECTKRAAAFGIWGVWSLFGAKLFGDLVDGLFDRGREFYEILRTTDDFETLHEPECNIVAFRHLPAALRHAPAAEVDAFQLRLRREVIESGQFYLVQTRLDGRNVLRATIMNPLTTRDDLMALVDALRHTGAKLLAAG